MSDSARLVPEEGAPRPSRRAVPDWVVALCAAARDADGSPPFSDQALVDYRMRDRELVAIDESAAALVTVPESSKVREPNTIPESSTVPEPVEGLASAEFVVAPSARGNGLGTRLLETLLGSTAEPMLFWAHGDHPAARALAASHGLVPARELLHLFANLSPDAELPTSHSVSSPTLCEVGNSRLGSFSVGADEDEWVALNARVFAHHAEQGSVTRADVEQLESEPWFRADDFLVLRDETGAMIGYCWVKIEDALGEIYVVGVSAEHQGEKLGGFLLEAGLAHIRDRGIHRAHLYVERDNTTALKLYLSRGFEQESIDIQYSSAAVGQ